MVFSSVEECIAYIENAISECMSPLSEEIKRVMDEVTYAQVRGWSGDIFNSVQPNCGGNFAEASFENNGGWYSLITGESVPNPIRFLEAGTTWNRSASNIMDVALGRCESEIPKRFLALMRSFGIPIS